MPTLARPDGAHLHWEETGEGPALLVCNTFNLTHLDALVEHLAGERRVITYDPRGLGRSSRGGPYDLDTGVDDLAALLEETGPVAVALGIGDGSHRAIRTAVRRPDLIDRVAFTSSALGVSEVTDDTGGFSGSVQVLSALMGLMRRDYRSGLRSMVSGSAGLDNEPAMRERVEELVESVPQEAALGYLEAWIRADSHDEARDLGSRLTVLAYPGNYWFPLSIY